jgi:diguanylate cyclase (GGDEF)-like protein
MSSDAASGVEEPYALDLTLPEMADALRRTGHAAAAIVIATGALVLLGWQAEIEALKRLVPGLTAMNPITAVGFILLGLSMSVLSRGRSTWMSAIGLTFAFLALGIGTAKVLAFLGIWDPELDRLLFRDELASADFGRDNQMAPNTALTFVLLGAALLTLDRSMGRHAAPAQLLALVAAMASLLALMGYAYGLRSFYGIGTHVAMALPTAAAFFVAAVGVLCVRPTRGIMAVVASRTSGGALVRRLLPAVVLVPAALGCLRWIPHPALVFDTALGLWLLVVSIMTVLAVLVGWNAHLLFRSDIAHAVAERKLAHQAMHDALTGLANRRLFVEKLKAALDRTMPDGHTAVLFVDLDLFKMINDSLGHVAGDELLVAAAQRIRDCVGPRDFVGRLSGDEFTVLLSDVADRDRATALAGQIKAAFDRPFRIGLHDVFTSVSIGIAFNAGVESPEDLIRHADIAMYRAKARGKARYEIFEPAMDLAVRQRQRLESDLRRALSDRQLRVYYQPEVEILTGHLVGMEALVRWEHPERGLICPADFIAVAEETGLIVPIGRWVLREACRQAREWQAKYAHTEPLMVSVNLSGKHLQQATLIDEVREVLEETRLDPAHLIIEITETVAMAGAETTIEILTKLKALGVLLAIDDFGTGFSSLSYLKRFPVDLLKIDKSFVDGVALHGHDTAIVEAIIALGHALGLRVIAEGVERPEQLMELRSLGSELGQGYFFSRPLSDDLRQGMPSLLEAYGRWAAEANDAARPDDS